MKVKSIAFIGLLLSTVLVAHAGSSSLETKLKDIAALGVPVVYPQHVPTRFSEVSVSTNSDTFEESVIYDYELKFCDKKDLCIQIRSGSCGLGGLPDDGNKVVTTDTDLFGTVRLHMWNPNTEFNSESHIIWGTEWLIEKKYTSAGKTPGCGNTGRNYDVTAAGLSEAELISVVKSMVLRP